MATFVKISCSLGILKFRHSQVDFSTPRQSSKEVWRSIRLEQRFKEYW